MAMNMAEYLRCQMQEALGDDNRWHCSKHYGYDVQDKDLLLAYYIKHGGATHFCKEHLADLTDNSQQSGRQA